MSTPRTIKASEVRKGMRVRVEREHPASGPRLAYTVVFEGVVSEATAQRFTIGEVVNDYTFWSDSNLPTTVTVLADPEPEWVEGAWYWTLTRHDGDRAIRLRVKGGWVERGTDTSNVTWRDSEDAITVLGRVLVVDWPGGDVARGIEDAFEPTYKPYAADTQVLKAVADAIRTQGGTR